MEKLYQQNFAHVFDLESAYLKINKSSSLLMESGGKKFCWVFPYLKPLNPLYHLKIKLKLFFKASLEDFQENNDKI